MVVVVVGADSAGGSGDRGGGPDLCLHTRRGDHEHRRNY